MLGATVRVTRWGFPWLGVLAISASIACATIAGLAGAQSAGDAVTNISGAQAPAQALVIAPPAESVATPARLSPATAALADGDDVRAVFLVGTIDTPAGDTCNTAGGRMQYVGLNSWIPAGWAVTSCPDGGS
jgi:hypothetical protein